MKSVRRGVAFLHMLLFYARRRVAARHVTCRHAESFAEQQCQNERQKGRGSRTERAAGEARAVGIAVGWCVVGGEVGRGPCSKWHAHHGCFLKGGLGRCSKVNAATAGSVSCFSFFPFFSFSSCVVREYPEGGMVCAVVGCLRDMAHCNRACINRHRAKSRNMKGRRRCVCVRGVRGRVCNRVG